MCICSTYCLQFHLEKWVNFLCLETGDAGMFEWMALYLNIVIIMMMIIIIISEVLFIVTLSWIALQGHFTQLMVKTMKVQPGKVSVTESV